MNFIMSISNYVVQQMPPGHVWVEGDNKKRSYDSRHFGPVPYGLIKGRVLFKVSNSGACVRITVLRVLSS